VRVCRLCMRQTSSGGLQGRPEKLQDVCYSWWAVASLVMVCRQHWIDASSLSRFILNSQDEARGGISDRPDDMVDVFHTFFGIAALSLLGHAGLRRISAAHALPQDVVDDWLTTG
jgi:geranylgeranyl transferase type-2 subunit beta